MGYFEDKFGSERCEGVEGTVMRGEKYTVADMLRWGWIDKEDAKRLLTAERAEDRRIKRLARGRTAAAALPWGQGPHLISPTEYPSQRRKD